MTTCVKFGGCCTVFIILVGIALQLWLKYGDQREYNYNTTADVAASNIDLTNKVIIVTGSNTGIGKPTGRVLLSHGAKVIMACRNIEKANNAKLDMINELINPLNNKINFKNYTKKQLNENIDVILLDLASLTSIKKFVKTFLNKNDKLNYLILNAGIMGLPQWQSTENGIEKQFGVNHIGHFYLTQLLTPILIETAKKSDSISRVISVSSNAIEQNAPYPIKPWLMNDSMVQSKNEYGPHRNYAFSKACLVLFSKEYNNRYGNDNTNVYSVSLHPGGIYTELGRHLHPTIQSILAFVKPFIELWTKTVEQGAATTIRTISISDQEFIKYAGSHFRDCNVANDKLRNDMNDITLQSMLWSLSEKLINEKIK